MQHGDKLTLKCGMKLQFLAGHPDDGACYIGMRWDEEADEQKFEMFEYSDVTLVNGKPRTPQSYEVVNYLVPILNYMSYSQFPVNSESRSRMFAIKFALNRDGRSMEDAIHAAMQECP